MRPDNFARTRFTIPHETSFHTVLHEKCPFLHVGGVYIKERIQELSKNVSNSAHLNEYFSQ